MTIPNTPGRKRHGFRCVMALVWLMVLVGCGGRQPNFNVVWSGNDCTVFVRDAKGREICNERIRGVGQGAKGDVKITRDSKYAIRIEYSGGTIQQVTVNGKVIFRDRSDIL